MAPSTKNKGDNKVAAVKAPMTGGVMRAHRYRHGVVALREIRTYQQTGDLLLPKHPFQELCREIAQDQAADMRFTQEFFEALQEAAEAFLVQVLSESNLAAIHDGRTTIKTKDMKYVVEFLKRVQKKE
ncbi:unnamed protein product [Caenorhabditis sp. 36 PRJEB53466]|nr:unnamed protein product [Caenorhabditis sp. 36 PRJEB53466]